MTRAVHLVGSPTNEFFADLSRLYARGALAAVGSAEDVVAHVSPDGRWSFPRDLSAESLAAAPSVDLAEAVAHLGALGPDVMIPQMFCPAGMTSYRGLFDVLGVPYVGNPPEVMAASMVKPRANALVAGAGVDVPRSEVLGPGVEPCLEPPVVVKPADADNSVGTTLVRAPGQYPDALASAFEHSSSALVQRFVPAGREVRCGVLDRGRGLECLSLEEYPVGDLAPIRGEADKLARSDSGDLGLVAKGEGRSWIVDVSDPVTEAVWEASRRCFAALGCRDYGLFDFRIDPDGRPWFLEAGPYCSFSPSSVVAVMAAAAGIELSALFSDLVARAVGRRS
ncbi:D-alanine--D-alanine ligase family protein [Actinomycetospora termitidis]|uniref:D-alanine--D-alanine ligase n=1 Tax=Actinomycetospora termitidis TaxID=3053470 RepID=A0ABT7M8N2_9PSEU|nr:D-alanine--D-alanine ligase [Actinomycetospora sp. Odt1-22]MDL5156402.1 D-alanine--D-alanine ligase [Actinomycetospora sp. Odt1-22]